MAVNITKTSHFTGGAGNPISFSQIRSEFGGSATNIKASTYLRNTDDSVDWNDEETITSRVPDATENNAVGSSTNWKVDSLRDTISKYIVTQTGTDVELSYSDSDTDTWENNLSKNVPKTFNVDGEIGANSTNDNALEFDGNLFNLDIDVNTSGAIYGEGGNINQNGGDALYVNNTYGKSDVKIRSFGKIWAGGGGGSAGNSGNRGESLNCFNTSTFTSDNGCGNATLYGKNPNGVRNRCRGGGVRRGSSPWNFNTMKGYDCGNGYTYYCRTRTNNNVTGGDPGDGGNGGVGRGFTNRNTNIDASPHVGNSGNNGNTTKCAANGNNSTGNKGNKGNSGGDFGQHTHKLSGRAVQKKNVKINYSTSSTVKGLITDI
tara:strand:+ start:97 stop:1221 length:1125 start_codon:yes stop_codon:yes gene_type:complete